MSTKRSIETFSAVLRSSGASRAIAFLNEGVPHRYTAAYALLDGSFHNVLLHDKLGEMRPAYLAVVPFEVSFCQFVLRDGLFLSGNTAADRRLDGHPYQGVVVSYHGVPLIDSVGELKGTLCHFDLQSLDLSESEFELLQKAARLLSDFLPRPD
jgi:GAF domain-containing protein